MKKFIHKLLVFLHLRHNTFSEIKYRGIPVIQRDDVPSGEIWLINDHGWKFRRLSKRYRGKGRPRKSDYFYSKKPKKI